MSAPHLLSLADLHTAAPGVLDVIFGADGDFEGAPSVPLLVLCRDRWWTVAGFTATDGMVGGALLVSADGTWPPDYESVPLSWCALDLRIPSIAARLAGLIRRVATHDLPPAEKQCIASALASVAGYWPIWNAALLAALTLALAPRIAALGGSRV